MKVGLFFGSFNPIHSGHLAVAEYLAEHADLNEIWFVVSPQNPLKPITSLLPDHDRLAMVKLAIKNKPKLKISEVEFNLPKPSYTIHTILHLKEKYPGYVFVLIIGEDNLATFNRWKNYEQILKECMVYVYPRSHVDQSAFHLHPKIKLIKDAPLMNLSATDIREGIRNKDDVRSMLPEAVWRYIEEKQLI